MYAHMDGCTHSADWDAVIRNKNITQCAKRAPTKTTKFRSCHTAAAAATNNFTLVLNVCPAIEVGHRNTTSARRRWRRMKRATQL